MCDSWINLNFIATKPVEKMFFKSKQLLRVARLFVTWSLEVCVDATIILLYDKEHFSLMFGNDLGVSCPWCWRGLLKSKNIFVSCRSKIFHVDIYYVIHQLESSAAFMKNKSFGTTLFSLNVTKNFVYNSRAFQGFSRAIKPVFRVVS